MSRTKTPLDASVEALDEASKTLKRYADRTDDYLRANPWKTLSAAAAAGVLVGVILARR
jgi:ElaB/YqjD/DUF883 family membrane-anchored ribosome-binding protein